MSLLQPVETVMEQSDSDTSSCQSTDVLGVQISVLMVPGAVATIEHLIHHRGRRYVGICADHTGWGISTPPRSRSANWKARKALSGSTRPAPTSSGSGSAW